MLGGIRAYAKVNEENDLGRHRSGTVDTNASDVDSGKAAAARHELLGWGIFIAVSLAAAMLIFAVPVQVVLLVPSVCLAAFVLLWLFMRLH